MLRVELSAQGVTLHAHFPVGLSHSNQGEMATRSSELALGLPYSLLWTQDDGHRLHIWHACRIAMVSNRNIPPFQTCVHNAFS